MVVGMSHIRDSGRDPLSLVVVNGGHARTGFAVVMS
eukprot:COSAG06_NODE_38630_length_421_cov_0.993789_1_plen_35_part_10